MEEPKLKLDAENKGAFVITDSEELIAEITFAIIEKELVVYHTEVKPKGEGKGLAKQLLQMMVAHARENKLKVVPLCQFVLAQFKRHPEEFSDVWQH